MLNNSKKRDARFWEKWRKAGSIGKYHPICVKYSSSVVPFDYKCKRCGATNCKLWREDPATAIPQLLCAYCAGKNEDRSVDDIDAEGTRTTASGAQTDSIGMYFPAVPDEEGIGYWNYTYVPKAGADWWRKLPTKPKKNHRKVS